MDRRSFIVAGAASAGVWTGTKLRAQPAAAVVPEAYMPRFVRVREVGPFEIHVLPREFALLWTLPEGRAIRYTVGVGRADLYQAGVFRVGAKREWPPWTPTPNMIARHPEEYGRWADGMPGGPHNPLGARALYLFTAGGADTFLRIHGTNEPHTIGSRVSQGCVRLVNSHVAHLYEQVPIGTRVVLHRG